MATGMAVPGRGTVLCALLLSLFIGRLAHASLIESLETRLEDGVGEIHIVFSVPVRYLKHFPAERGELLKIYLQALGSDVASEVTQRGAKSSPAMALVPSHTVTYTTAQTCFATRDPLCLDVQFNHPVQFRIRPGEDGHSLSILILPQDSAPASRP